NSPVGAPEEVRGHDCHGAVMERGYQPPSMAAPGRTAYLRGTEMLKKILLCGVAAMMTASCGGDQADTAGGQAGGAIVLIDGSSTVFPISEALGEEFQKASGNRVTVGLSGTGGG